MSYNIQIDRIFENIKAGSKRQFFKVIAENIAPDFNLDTQHLVSRFIDQEKSINSGIGDGIAVCGLKLPGLERRHTVLATLADPLPYGAYDQRNVDLIVIQFSPLEDGNIHLRGLSRLTRLFKNKILVERLREADDKETLYSLIHNPEGWLLAA